MMGDPTKRLTRTEQECDRFGALCLAIGVLAAAHYYEGWIIGLAVAAAYYALGRLFFMAWRCVFGEPA